MLKDYEKALKDIEEAHNLDQNDEIVFKELSEIKTLQESDDNKQPIANGILKNVKEIVLGSALVLGTFIGIILLAKYKRLIT